MLDEGPIEESLPVAEDGRWVEAAEKKKKSKRRPTKPKPREVVEHLDAINTRNRQVKLQQGQEAEGKEVIGVTKMKELDEVIMNEWREIKCDRKDAAEDKRKARGINCLYPEKVGTPSGALFGAWRAEESGWTRVEVVMDSGAAECVCPKTMAPHFPIIDTQASLAGVYYTSANGGKISNLGQQTIPVAFENGIKCQAVFQVAEVSRPLMSVAKICELGNRVMFGAGGGLIMNLNSGEVTPFEKKDGVYIFTLWIPPLSVVQGGVGPGAKALADSSFTRPR